MNDRASKNIFFSCGSVTRSEREKMKKQRACCLWFTGLSASGKSTIASMLEQRLLERNLHTFLLDGDNLRCGLNHDLGFSSADRTENIRRTGEVAKLFVDAGIIVLAAFISPFRKDRDNIRKIIDEGRFIEIYVNSGLAVCETRDTKGLYKKARSGEIAEFTGISSPYEPPENPEVTINNGFESSLDDHISILIDFLETRGIIK